MNNTFTPVQMATGKIELGLTRLASRYPFHAHVLEQFKLVPMPEVSTMGVAIVDGTLLLVFSTVFVLQTPINSLVGVLHYECNHVVLGHLLNDPKDYPDEWARTVAQEVTVNEFVSEPLPGEPILLEQFPRLPPLESTKQRYDRLTKRKKRFPISSPLECSDDPAGSAASSGASSGAGQHTTDDHEIWQQALSDPAAAQAAIRAAVQLAVLTVGITGLPQALQDAIADLGVGTKSANQKYQVQGGRPGHLDWRKHLRRQLGRLPQTQPTLSRPSRRLPELVGLVPGSSGRASRPNVMAVIDTSGSITPKLIEDIDGELRRLARWYAVTVVECDCEIHAVYRYRRLVEVTGRGGTDFHPPLEADFLRRHRADVVVYFMDGEGPAPERPPRVPVIWCLVEGGVVPAPWGRPIFMG